VVHLRSGCAASFFNNLLAPASSRAAPHLAFGSRSGQNVLVCGCMFIDIFIMVSVLPVPASPASFDIFMPIKRGLG
jgi:hypothetical protein